MVGNFDDVSTPEKRCKINHVTRWYKPWFYKHVETFLTKVSFQKSFSEFLELESNYE
jgi:delta24-sterol reductase